MILDFKKTSFGENIFIAVLENGFYRIEETKHFLSMIFSASITNNLKTVIEPDVGFLLSFIEFNSSSKVYISKYITTSHNPYEEKFLFPTLEDAKLSCERYHKLLVLR